MKKFLVIFFIVFFFTPKVSLAQANDFDSPYACPNFEFVKDLQKGIVDEDVFVLQQILNLDRRTLVAQTGVGSKGNETANFGAGTREALKRFQALFIEYIEVADGKFNTKTRTVMNNVCKGPFFTGVGGNVYDNAINNDQVPPLVGISGPKQIDLTENANIRAYIGANEAIKTPNLTGLIIEGGTASDIRKTSSTTFSFLVTPNDDVKDIITLQFEADSLEDLAGNKNEIASNEWEILIIKSTSTQDLSGDLDTSILDDILNSVVSTIATSTNCASVGNVDVYDYSNPCYGKAPMTGGQGATPEEKKDDGMMQMLGQVLQGLMQAMKGMKDAGGHVGGNAVCGCTGAPTTQFDALMGISGRNIDSITKGKMSGEFVGKQGPPPGICGVRPRGGPKDKCAGIPGPHNGSCCGILLDVTMQPVTGTVVN